MVAMSVVLFLEQWFKDCSHVSALLGIALSLLCRILFGAQSFILPSMLAILAALTLLRRPLEKGAYPA